MSHEDAQAVFDIVHQTSAIQKAQDLAAKYTNKALKGIAKLPDNQVQTKENLAHLTKAIYTRVKIKSKKSQASLYGERPGFFVLVADRVDLQPF